MTVLISFKKDDEVWLASDKRVTIGDFITYQPEEQKKFIVLENSKAIIAPAGLVFVADLLNEFIDSTRMANFSFENKQKVSNFFIAFKEFINEYRYISEKTLENSSLFLLATPKKIFYVDGSFGITEVRDFIACGSGMDIAVGALEYCFNYDKEQSPEEIIKRVMEIVFKRNNTCGDGYDIVNVTKYFANNNRKGKR